MVGPFPATERHQELVDNLEDNCDESCMEVGSRWTLLYALCGLVALLLTINSLVQILGTWNYSARLLSGCCFSLFSCANLAAIIVTGVYRLNSMGQLAAMSQTPSMYSSDNQNEIEIGADFKIQFLSQARTFEDDGMMILYCWFGMILLFFGGCLCTFGPAASRKPLT